MPDGLTTWAPPRSYGLLSARPAANTVPDTTTYFATDDNGGTLYQAQAAAWVRIAARGIELARQDVTTNVALTTTLADVATITFTATDRPIEVEYFCSALGKDATAGYVWASITDNSNVEEKRSLVTVAASGFGTQRLTARYPSGTLGALTAGTSYTKKVRANTSAGGGTVNGGSGIYDVYLRAYEV